MQGKEVYVMFRNWLNGNRDLYLARSTDGGRRFSEAQKLGTGNWALNACPMDGGALVLNRTGQPETIWQRKKIIYSATPGQPEQELGEGRACTMLSANGRQLYAWVEDGNIVVQHPGGLKEVLGKGSLPLLVSAGKEQALCIWENDRLIRGMLVSQ
jgi:hypothetical protein